MQLTNSNMALMNFMAAAVNAIIGLVILAVMPGENYFLFFLLLSILSFAIGVHYDSKVARLCK